LKTVDKTSLEIIRVLTNRRDQHARVIGIAFVEMELARAKSIAQSQPNLMYAATVEFEGFRQRYMEKIANDCKRQESVGKAAMRALGINPDGKTSYTIDLATGAVKVLKNGAWEDVQ
jgi:hypothetical protein